MKSNFDKNILGIIAILAFVALILLMAYSVHCQDTESDYYVLNIPNVEKAKVCEPKPFLWVIPHWGNCKIVEIAKLILFVRENGEDLPAPKVTPTVYVPMTIPKPAQ